MDLCRVAAAEVAEEEAEVSARRLHATRFLSSSVAIAVSGGVASVDCFTGILVFLPDKSKDDVGNHAHNRRDNQHHQKLTHGMPLSFRAEQLAYSKSRVL
jgi:hypothetical protein